MIRHRRVVPARVGARARLLVVLLACAGGLGSSVPATLAATGPTAGPPDVRFTVNHALGTVKVPLTVSWPVATPGDAPLAKYQLQQRTDGGTWRSISLLSALGRSVVVTVRPGALQQFRVRAVDTAGTAGAWTQSAPHWLALVHEHELEVGYAGDWKNASLSSAHGSRVTLTSQAGALATYAFRATRVAWVAHRASNRGRATVSVENGGQPTVVDLRRSTTQARRIVYARAWADAAPRVLSIEAEGTAGRPRVDVDALLTLGPAPTGVLVGAGDIATCPGSGDEATAAVIEGVPGTVFTTGDNAYPDGTAAQFKNCYGPSWGRFKARTRPSPGNHDYNSSSTAAPYFTYFGANAGTAGRGWYAYDAGTWRVYSLNSNCSYAGGCGTSSAQYTWLKKDLAANPRRCVAAYWHHPRFSSGYHGGSTKMRYIVSLLYENGADVVLAGHDHSYERFGPISPTNTPDPARGIRHFVVGSGGAPLYAPGANPAPNSQVLETQTHGVLKLTLTWNGYEWQFLPAGEGTFTDTGSDTCH